MQSKIYRLCLRLLLSINLMSLSTSVPALTDDDQQPIHIDSMQQAVDMTTNTVTLTGDVVLKRGSIDVRASQVVITRPGGKEVIEGYGHPVTFYQLQNDGTPVRGHAQKVRYEAVNDLVIMTGNAYLEQLNSNIKADRITFLVKKKKMEAFSNKGKRVTTMIVPMHLRNKSTDKA